MVKYREPKKQINHHFVFIEAPVEIVGPQAILWGEASWWPEDCKTKFKKDEEGEIIVGTIYKQIVPAPFSRVWKVEVTKLVENRLVERTFLSGMFKGHEVILIGERANGTRIDYELHYRTRGLHNKILWTIFKSQHDKNIKSILKALKEYSLGKYAEESKEE